MPDPAVFPQFAGRHLFFFAHPDDDCFAAGLLYRLLQRKADVHAVWVTSGDARGGAALREAELEKAMKPLGVTAAQTTLLRFPNRGLLPVLTDLRSAFLELLHRFNPAYCYVTAWEGGHVDHDLINKVVCSALRVGEADRSFVKAYEFPLYNITGPRFLLRWRVNGFPPGGTRSCSVPLTRTEITVKRRMMRSYTSQWQDMLPFMLAMPGRRLRRTGEQYRLVNWRDGLLQRPHSGLLNYERGPNRTSFSDVATALNNLEAMPVT